MSVGVCDEKVKDRQIYDIEESRPQRNALKNCRTEVHLALPGGKNAGPIGALPGVANALQLWGWGRGVEQS
jgi:hypothetical protein